MLLYDISRSPLLRHIIAFCTISNNIRHNSIAKAAFVLIHQNGLAAMVSKVVFQVTTEVRWWEINLDTLLGILFLDELHGRVSPCQSNNNLPTAVRYA